MINITTDKQNKKIGLIKTMLKMFFIYISAIAIGYLALVAAYSIPYNLVKDNINSAYSIQDEQIYFDKIENHDENLWYLSYYKQDWTGISTMLSIMANVSLENKDHEKDVNPWYDSIYNRFISTRTYYGVYNLDTNDQSNLVDDAYYRYWHGYIPILKPLFILFDFQTIRILNIIFQAALIFIVCWLMHKRKLDNYIIAFLLTCLLLGTPLIGLSFQLSTCVNIMLIFAAILLWKYEKLKRSNNILLFYFITGIVVNYFDFLTYPLITFFIPFILMMLLEDNYVIKKNIKNLIISLTVWLLGYILFWMAKWIICWAVLDIDITSVLLDRIQLWRIGGPHYETWYNNNLYYALSVNWSGLLLQLPFSLTYIIFFALWTMDSFDKFADVKKQINIPKIIIIAIICIIPLIWLSILLNHSASHYRYTYRNLSIWVFAISCLLLSINNPFRFKEINNNLKS